ncbi:MAG TPA: hypothetical protein VNN10_04370 [Dehalococcoidia bacterium]|nr:hypothetical protein [Dehalococcoidia bacterium]
MLVAAGLVFLALACSSDDGPAPPSGEGCPVAAVVCEVAAEVGRAAAAGDFSAIVAAGAGQDFTCPSARPEGLGGPYPLCDGARAGEKRQGFPLAYVPGEGLVEGREGVLAALNNWTASAVRSKSDAFGDGSTRVFTVGCPEKGRCEDYFAVVLSNLGTVPFRLQAVLFFRAQQGQPRLTSLAIGWIADMTQSEVVLSGGRTRDFLRFQGWPALTDFHRVTPSDLEAAASR